MGPGPLGLTKVGTGTVILTGANTYSGATTISGGTLLANTPGPTNSATGTGSMSVNSTGTLGGNGRVAGTVTVAQGGTITPGTGVGATILATGAATIQGHFLVNVFGTGVTDIGRLNSSGILNLTSSTDSLELALNGTSVASLRAAGAKTYTIAGYTSETGTFDTTDFTTAGFQASEWSVNYGATAITLSFTPVPEPSTVLAIAVGALGFGGLVRRRLRNPTEPTTAA